MATKTRRYTKLVHAHIDGTDRSPLVGIREGHGYIWAMDEDALRKLIKFATGCEPVFGESILTNAEVDPKVLRHHRNLARKMGKWTRD